MSDFTRREFLAGGLAMAAGATAFPQDSGSGLVVHEWGVLTMAQEASWSKARTGGIRLDAKRTEIASPPPDFAASWTALVGKQIEEWKNRPLDIDKPVVYFYTDRLQTVTLRVGVPSGRPALWWPPVSDFSPRPPRLDWGNSFPNPPPPIESIEPKEGSLIWQGLQVDSSRGATRFRSVPKEHWWQVARETDAATVSAQGQFERFVFYEALSPVTSSLSVEWSEDSVVVRNTDTVPVSPVIAIRVQKSSVQLAAADTISSGEELRLAPNSSDISALESRLRRAGLFEKEAAGMAKIWRTEFFETDGLRVLYFMPETRIRSLLPMQIEPAPDKLVRVLLVHIECLSPGTIRDIDTLIAQLKSDDLNERDGATEALRKLLPRSEGRLRRALKTAKDLEVRSRIESILRGVTPRP